MMSHDAKNEDIMSILLDKRHLPFVAIIFFVFLNAFFNSMATAYGYGHYPLNTFLFYAEDLHADLIKMSLGYFQDGKTYDISSWVEPYHHYYKLWQEGFFQKNHLNNSHMPPLSFTIGWIVSLLLQRTTPLIVISIYYTLVVITIILIAIHFKRKRYDIYILSLGMLISYPVLFVLTRGNIFAFINSITILLFIYLLLKRQYLWLAVILLSVSINIHPNAILIASLLFLLPIRNALKYSAITIIVSATIFFTSLYLSHVIDPGYTLNSFLSGLKNYTHLYLEGNLGVLFNNSLYGMIRTFLIAWKIHLASPWLIYLNTAIATMGIFTLLLSIYFVHGRRLTPYEFSFVTLGIYTLTSAVFAVYHLIPYFVFLLMPFVISDTKKLSPKHFSLIILVSVFLLIPKNYIFVYFLFGHILSIETILNPLVLSFAIGYILFSAKKVDHVES